MKKEIESYIRENIAALFPYSTARDEYKGDLGTFLDANESPYENMTNRYPDPQQKELKALLGKIKGISAGNIFLGNGSDEAIDLVFRIFCTPGKDNAIAITPSYGMYKVAAAINDIKIKEVPLGEDFGLPAGKILEEVDSNTKVIFLCSPNNPTGNSFPAKEMLQIAEKFNGIMVIDEAYIDFSRQQSMASWIGEYPNIIVLQTLSKAWGMAGLRIGLAVADKRIIEVMGKVKYPYNINVASMRIAMEHLERGIGQEIAEIISEREKLAYALGSLPIVEKVYPSDANFILAKFNDADAVYSHLISEGIIVRNRNSVKGCAGCLRISIGMPQENARLLESLGRFNSGTSDSPAPFTAQGRSAHICRKSAETDIEVHLNLDGKGKSGIDTGLNFLDHMLQQLVHHGGISLNLKCRGDLHVDEHHTMEDVAIVLGEAIYAALGSKRGIERYGFFLPMDECRALVLLDFGGRADFVWNVPFTRERVGDVPTEMFRHFFKSLCIAMKANLQIEASGENNHHLIEGVYKAFARALKCAVRRDIFKYELPSSKGML